MSLWSGQMQSRLTVKGCETLHFLTHVHTHNHVFHTINYLTSHRRFSNSEWIIFFFFFTCNIMWFFFHLFILVMWIKGLADTWWTYAHRWTRGKQAVVRPYFRHGELQNFQYLPKQHSTPAALKQLFQDQWLRFGQPRTFFLFFFSTCFHVTSIEGLSVIQ